MTAPIILPQPVRLDAFRAGGLDVRGIDFTADLLALADTIRSVDNITVMSRDDNAGLQSGDLSILENNPSPPYVDETNMIIGWWQTCDATLFVNGVTVDYRLRIELTTNLARHLICDAMQLVMPVRG